jgi:hypothetical protein
MTTQNLVHTSGLEARRKRWRSWSGLSALAVLMLVGSFVLAVPAQAGTGGFKYGNNTFTATPTSATEASFDNSSGTGEGVFFIDNGVRLFDENDGTIVTSSTGDEESICETSNGTREDPFNFYSNGHYSQSLIVIYWSGSDYPDGDSGPTVSWNGFNWHIAGSTRVK